MVTENLRECLPLVAIPEGYPIEVVMRDDQNSEEDAAAKATVRPLLLAGIAAAVGAAGTIGAFAFDLPGAISGGNKEQAMGQPAKGKSAMPQIELMKLDPFVVSLTSSTRSVRSSRLRFAVAVETDNPELVDPLRYRLRNDFIAAIYALDDETLRGPDGLETLRQVLEPRAKAILGDHFRRLLITEFVLI